MKKGIKILAAAIACLSLASFASCAVVFDYEMESEKVVGEQVASAEEWDNAFKQANALAEQEGVKYMMEVQTCKGYQLFGDTIKLNTDTLGYYTEGTLEGKAQGKLSYSYNVYQSDVMMTMADTGTCYRVEKSGDVIDIVPTNDGKYKGTYITDILQEAIPVSWKLFDVADNLGDAALAYSNAEYSAKETAYCMTYEEDGYTQTSWVWIVDGVVRKYRREEKSRVQTGTNFYTEETCIEVYVGGMNGTVKIPNYTM